MLEPRVYILLSILLQKNISKVFKKDDLPAVFHPFNRIPGTVITLATVLQSICPH